MPKIKTVRGSENRMGVTQQEWLAARKGVHMRIGVD
jgi:hypothetical protein